MLFRRVLVWIFGAPVCGGCVGHRVDCVGYCKLTDAERTARYIEGTA